MARLTAEFWVHAYLARLRFQNIPAFVVSHGDDTAGAVLIKMNTLDGNAVIDAENKSGKSARQVVMLIVLMNLIFSFDSILSALAITDVFPVLAAAILLSGAAMLLLADGVTKFLEKNRMYEVLGLFILLIVGVVLLGEAGPAAAHAMHDDSLQIKVFGYDLIPMSKTTFYFSVIVLFLVEAIQSGYSRKLAAERRREQSH